MLEDTAANRLQYPKVMRGVKPEGKHKFALLAFVKVFSAFLMYLVYIAGLIPLP